ncbi:MAG: hypothetical protein EHM93_16920 [Bacteroidales bacterium]|nr:MAG: hypothetical protein EHM93_16920 [Bacteroidales bacterium]
MKKIFYIPLFVLLALQCNLVLSQNAYYDAVRLEKMVVNGKVSVESDADMKIFNSICLEYKITKLEIKNNPFLSALISNDIIPNSTDIDTKYLSDLYPNIVGKMGGLNVTSLADGLARFLVERTKEEMNVIFFEQFEQFVSSNLIIKKLFPKTTPILLVAKDKMYSYQLYLPMLREAFEQDLRDLLVGIDSVVNCKECIDLKLTDEERNYISLVLNVLIDIQKGMHPGDILDDLARKDQINGVDQNIKSSILMANLISRSLKSDNPERYWISSQEFSKFNNPDFAAIYMGLLYQQILNNGKSDPKSYNDFKAFIDDNKNDIQSIVRLLQILYKNADEIDRTISKITKDRNGSLSDFFALGQRSVSMLSEINAVIHPEGKQKEQIDYCLLHISNLMADINVRSYNSAVFETYLLLDSLTNLDKPTLEKFIKYGSFIATVSVARDSKEVQMAIESVALPSGSYRIKRESSFSVTLNGYVGFFGGNEHVKGAKNSPFFNSYGVTAPVGIALNWGGIKPCRSKVGHSFTTFFSLVDIGALAAYRFMDDSSSTVPKVELKDIISPGVFLSWGFGKTPFALSVGYQLGPILRKVAPTVNTFADNKYTRFSITLTVDIPIFNFYTKPKKE